MDERVGPTGRFVGGQIRPDDKGELRFAIIANPARGIVVVDLGTPVAWIGLRPSDARQIAATLFRAAEQVEAAGPPPARAS